MYSHEGYMIYTLTIIFTWGCINVIEFLNIYLILHNGYMCIYTCTTLVVTTSFVWLHLLGPCLIISYNSLVSFCISLITQSMFNFLEDDFSTYILISKYLFCNHPNIGLS
jgi:hypothetical protein